MTTERPDLDAMDEQLGRLLRKMERAATRGEAARYGELKAARDALKAERMEAEELALREAWRARRAAAAPASAPSLERWRLPFTRSPLARERDRQPVVDSQPQVPAGGHLNPWRGWHPASTRIWWPGE